MNNLIEDHYADDEKLRALSLMEQLRNTVKPRTRKLSSEERHQYGSIREQTKLLVQKTMDYHNSQSNLDCPVVNWMEMEADWSDRTFLEALSSLLLNLYQMVDNTRIVHDYDLYQKALVDYQYTQCKAEGTEEPGFKTKLQALKPFMPRISKAKDEERTPLVS